MLQVPWYVEVISRSFYFGSDFGRILSSFAAGSLCSQVFLTAETSTEFYRQEYSSYISDKWLSLLKRSDLPIEGVICRVRLWSRTQNRLGFHMTSGFKGRLIFSRARPYGRTANCANLIVNFYLKLLRHGDT